MFISVLPCDARNRTVIRLFGETYPAAICLFVEGQPTFIEDSSLKETQLNGADRPVYLGEIVNPASGESYDWHAHNFGQLITAVSGSMFVGIPDCVLLLSPAMAIWIPSGTAHWMRCSSNNVTHYVDVNRDEADRLGHDCWVVSMTPLLSALFVAAMPEATQARGAKRDL